jgi:hypothetical protein
MGAFSGEEKLDLLFKKVAGGVTKTGRSDTTGLDGESISSFTAVAPTHVWKEATATNLPGTPPSSNTAYVGVYEVGGSGSVGTTGQVVAPVTCSSVGSSAHMPNGSGGTFSNFKRAWDTGLENWIGPAFGSNYKVRVYVGASGWDGTEGGKSTSSIVEVEFGQNPNADWNFDYEAGILYWTNEQDAAETSSFEDSENFVSPGSVITNGDIVYVTGYRYIGQTGVGGTITGGASTIASADLTVNRALVSNGDGKVAVSDVTATELGYLDGVTSAIQAQINGKQDALTFGIANTNIPIFTSGVADDDFLRIAGTSVEGRSASEVLSDIGGQAALTFGIANTNAVKIDSSSVADNEYARFTAAGLESRTTAEVLSDIGAQASLTFGIANTNAVQIDSSSVADDEYARFTANGLESRSNAEVLSDIGAQGALTFGIGDTNIPIFTSGVADNDFLKVAGTSIEGRSAAEVLSDIGAVAANTAITGATATKITFDAKGLVTAGTSLVAGDIPDLSGTYLTGETDPVFTAHTTSNITNGAGFLKNNGSGTWSYDNQTYLTSETSHADVLVDGDFGSQGIMLRGSSSGQYSILLDNSGNWNTAFGWGNHASAGYLLSETFTNVGVTEGANTAHRVVLTTVSAGGTLTGVQVDTSDLTYTPSADTDRGKLTTGDLLVKGNLTVLGEGSLVNLQQENLIVKDPNIILGAVADEAGTISTAQAGDVGITAYIDGTDDPALTYNKTDEYWELNNRDHASAPTLKIAQKYTVTASSVGASFVVAHNLNTRDVIVQARNSDDNEIVYVKYICNTTQQTTIYFGSGAQGLDIKIVIIG